MKAAFYDRLGAAGEVLSVGEQPLPEPGFGDVRVRLHTSGVNPSDVKSRRGHMGPMAFPLIIPHSDGAGVIESVGAGVPKQRLGERVWIWNGQWQRAFGTAAEYIVLPTGQAVLLPDDVDFAAGACLGIPALTAYHAINLTGASRGQTILVSGGAGAVGNYAIQIAQSRGLRVLATVSSDLKGESARAAGAEVINYKSEDVGARVKQLTGGQGVDAVAELDISTNAALLPAVLKAHGTVAVYGYSVALAPLPVQWLMRCSIDLRFLLVYDLTKAQRQDAIDGLSGLLATKQLMHHVAQRFPLDRIVAAHEAVESNQVMGKVVIDIA